MTRKRKTSASWNIPPGEILREDILKAMKITPYELATQLHVPAPRINDIILEKRGITADTALRLARYFGTTEQFWMNLQASYEVRRARASLRPDLLRIRPRRSRTPE